MLLDHVATTSAAVAATSARSGKVTALADLLRRCRPDEAATVVAFLVGEPRQGRIGVGWASLRDVGPGEAREPTLTVGDVDAALTRLAATTGAGSGALRSDRLATLFRQATPAEADFLKRLLLGDLRQGALAGLVTDAVARAADVPLAAVRRAAMLTGDVGRTAAIALGEGRPGLATVGLRVGRPVLPMLAATAGDVSEALTGGTAASVEAKLDGIRIQVHRDGDEVGIFTRNLNDVTTRLPEVVDVAAALPVPTFVLDGELLGVREGTEATPFQDTMSRFGRDDAATSSTTVRPYFFDVLHAGGTDLLDEPLDRRRAALREVAGPYVVDGIVTADAAEAAAFMEATVGAGHEGVVVKALDSAYAAGRRGKAWHKVKPVHTLDLVVIGVEWGHGRRTGLLSNLHLGARDPSGGPPVMVGKTFKGLTDELLAFQTEALLARETGRDGITVFVRPELVVEIAVDGAQSSSRYPGGVALRFARVRRYRPDKDPAAADTIGAIRALLPG